MYLLKKITLEHGSKETVLLNQDSEERLIAWLDKQPDEGIEDYFISDSVPNNCISLRRRAIVYDPEIAKEDAMWKEFMRIHGTPKNGED